MQRLALATIVAAVLAVCASVIASKGAPLTLPPNVISAPWFAGAALALSAAAVILAI